MKKNEHNLIVTSAGRVTHSRSQKIWGAVALVGLFLCGVMIGVTMGGGQHENALYRVQCDSLAKEIVYATQGINCSGTSKCLDLLKELNDAYAKNCAGHHATVDTPKSTKSADKITEPKNKTCEEIESILSGWLRNDMDSDADMHKHNIEVYTKLVANGCPENKEKYQSLIKREQDIIIALTGNLENGKTCNEIEKLLLMNLPYAGDIAGNRIERAKIYANIAERGCAENRQKYIDLASRELEIARALRDDGFSSNETVAVVETYKRLQMQAAAQDVIDKVKKITNPAIDFILQVEKIINE